MYIIMIDNDDTMRTKRKERIMQRSKLFDSLYFFAEPTYRGYDMKDCKFVLEYHLPVSHAYCEEELVLSEHTYKDYLVFEVPLDTNLTKEAGDIEMMITISMLDSLDDGTMVVRVRKVDGGMITISPVPAWSDLIPDSALSALDQRIIKMDAQLKALGIAAEEYAATKADNLTYDEVSAELQLTAKGQRIGDKVNLGDTLILDGEGTLSDLYDVVEF